MIEDFWLGVLSATVVALALIVLGTLGGIFWLVGWLSRYSEIRAVKDQKGAVGLTVDVRKA